MTAAAPDQIARLRAFNRRYTRAIGLLGDGYHGSPFTVTESRVLYEIAREGARAATDLQRSLGLDRGHVSRLLARLERRGLIAREVSPDDGRQRVLNLTAAGQAAFDDLDRGSERQAAALLDPFPPALRSKALAALDQVERLFGEPAPAQIVLRDPRPGDMGWIVERNAVLYAEEYGWNNEIEAVCAELVAAFIRNFDPTGERCWIAERDGRRVGCVYVSRDSAETARLRLLLVESEARGTGLGGRLIAECVNFARQAGYREMVLWTHSVLVDARRLYARAGFELVESHAYVAFGHPLVSETWRMDL